MRPLRALAVYIAVVFVGGALLAPWLYRFAQLFAHVLPGLASSPFHRYMSRAFLGLALLGMWPLLKAMGATSLRDAGLVSPAGQWNRLVAGFGVGFISLAVVAVAQVAAGARRMDPSMTPVSAAGKVGAIALGALVVAVPEELLFRGAIFGALRRVFDWILALVLSSMIYAIVHFLQPVRHAGLVDWATGLELLPGMLAGFTQISAMVPGFLNLTLVGVLLGLAYQRTGNLYFSIGLHAGWIFWLRSFSTLTAPAMSRTTSFWGTPKLVDGWLVTPVLLILLAVFVRWPGKDRRPSHL